jgi:hypothetical protein
MVRRTRNSTRYYGALFAVMILTTLHAGRANAQAGPAVHDVITNTFTTECLDPDPANTTNKPLDLSQILPDITKLQNGAELQWSQTELYKIAAKASKMPTSVGKIDKNQAYIFHVDHWGASPAYLLVSSDWYVYKSSGPDKLKRTGYTASGDQLLYGLKRVLIITVEVFDNGGKSGPMKITYKTSVVQGTPANSEALGDLISALLGITSKSTAYDSTTGCEVMTAASFQEGTVRLPFDLNVALSAATKPKPTGGGSENTKQPASAGVADCPNLSEGGTCTLTRKFTSLDREWWDVSIGVAIPGVRETQYSIVNAALTSKVKTHTDFYGFFDICPAAIWKSKDTLIPHLAVGLPLTSQTFYRPFFGVSESVTNWFGLQKRLGLPVGINFFAGVVYMKTSVVTGSPTTPSELSADSRSLRVVKPVFGVEVPVKALVSKIGKSGAKNSNSKTSGNANPQSSGS